MQTSSSLLGRAATRRAAHVAPQRKRTSAVVAAGGRFDDFGDSRGGGGYSRGRDGGGGGRGGRGGGTRQYDNNRRGGAGGSWDGGDGEPGQRRSGGGGYSRGGEGGGYRNDRGGEGGGYRERSDRGEGGGGYRNDRGGEGGGYRGGERGEGGGGYRGRGGPRGGLPGGDGRPQRVLSEEATALNATIKGAASWRELQRVLESAGGGGSGLDPFQLVAMLSRAAQLPAPAASEPDNLADYQEFVASVFGCLLDKVDAARPAQLGRALSCVARLGLYNAELVDALAARSERELHNFRDADLVLLIQGMAALGYAPSPAFAEQLLRRSQGRLRTMDARTLSSLLGALPRLGVAPTPEWMAACADAALGNVRAFNAPEFSALLVALATAGWRPAGPEQLQPLVDRCFPLLTYELRVEQGGRPAAPRPQQQQGGRGYGYERPQPVEPQVAIDWLVNVSWAFAQMVAGTGAAMPEQWTKAIFDRVQYVRRYMRPAELASLVSSCGYLGARPSDDTVASLLRDLQNMYADATADDLANVAMALAQFQYRPADRFLDDFLITLRRKLPTASATGLSTVVAALPSLSSGVRLNEVVADAQARYDALAAAAQQQEAEYAAAAAAGEAAEGYEGYAAQDAAQDPAAPEAVAA